MSKDGTKEMDMLIVRIIAMVLTAAGIAIAWPSLGAWSALAVPAGLVAVGALAVGIILAVEKIKATQNAQG